MGAAPERTVHSHPAHDSAWGPEQGCIRVGRYLFCNHARASGGRRRLSAETPPPLRSAWRDLGRPRCANVNDAKQLDEGVTASVSANHMELGHTSRLSIAIGLAHLNGCPDEAMGGLEGCFAAQWSTAWCRTSCCPGGQTILTYSGPEWWGLRPSRWRRQRPAGNRTTGISVQPPVPFCPWQLQRIWQRRAMRSGRRSAGANTGAFKKPTRGLVSGIRHALNTSYPRTLPLTYVMTPLPGSLEISKDTADGAQSPRHAPNPIHRDWSPSTTLGVHGQLPPRPWELHNTLLSCAPSSIHALPVPTPSLDKTISARRTH